MEEALQTEESVRKEYDEICEAFEHLAQERSVTPPPALKDRLMDALAEQDAIHETAPLRSNQPKAEAKKTRQKPKQSFIARLDWKLVAAASVVLLLGSLSMNYIYYQRLVSAEQEAAILRNNGMLLSDENGILKTQIELSKEQYAFLENKNLRAVTLAGTTGFPDREALVFWDRQKGDVYVVSNALPPLEENQQYQLWALDNGVPVDAGILPEDLKDGGAYKLKNISSSQAFAITIEKTGGSPTPTLDKMVVFGNL